MELNIDLRPALSEYNWGITSEVKKELDHYEIGSFFTESEDKIIKFSQQELESHQNKHSEHTRFDLADQQLLGVALRENAILLTDDTALYLEAIGSDIISMLLPHFCLFLVKKELLRKKTARTIFMFWEKKHAYKLKFLKNWRNELEKI
jgi:hypothetical protein